MSDERAAQWASALSAAGLGVHEGDVGARRPDAPVLGQYIDEETGAVVFADLGLAEDRLRLTAVMSRGAAHLSAPVWERDMRPERLRWFRRADREAGPTDATIDPDGLARLAVGPCLVFLHDTFGRTDADFAALDVDLHEAVSDRYEGRVVGFDHHTLCATPVQNASVLARALAPTGQTQTVDIVGLGRGGLVARELAERRLAANISIGRLITIGTPHAGTPLVDADRLLAWLNRIVGVAPPSADRAAAVASVIAHVLDGTTSSLIGVRSLGVVANTALDELNALPPAIAASYVMIAGDLPPIADAVRSGPLRLFVPALDDEPNDGFVTVRSAHARRPDGRGDIRPADRHVVPWGPDELVASRALADVLITHLTGGSASASGHGDRVVVVRGTRVNTVRDLVADDGATTTSDSSEPVLPLTVNLLHASLEHSGHTVLVGHFAGSPLTGAEERLDDCLDHRLSRAQVARDYPEALGEFRHFPGDDEAPPFGAIVIGLGPVGDLTDFQLTSSVTRAVVRYASERRDEARVAWQSSRRKKTPFPLALKLSSVLMATSRSGGMSVENSIRSIVAGVAAANLRLRPTSAVAGGATDAVAVCELTLVERYEDNVELAARAMAQLAVEGHREGHQITFTTTPRTGEGSTGPNPPSDVANTVWTRVSIERGPQTDDGLTAITYSVMARLARAEQVNHQVDHDLVEALVAQSISRTTDPRIGATLYELLLPHELKQQVGSGPVHILVDDDTADYPYELLTPRESAFRSNRPLALGGGLLRQFVERHATRQAPVRAPEPAVLVIGNPPTGGVFAALPGARTEAVEVARAFGDCTDRPWQVTARIWDGAGAYEGTPIPEGQTTDPAENLVHELLTGSWRVVHIAAHGTIDPSGSIARSGVALSATRRLTPTTAEQLSVVPDLVVVNACHLGTIRRQLDGMNRVAASLARSLMRIGVRAVIAAGWAVDDQGAAIFAQVLYEELLAGRELCDALHAARSAVHQDDPDTLTWGAYQCYGDPGFRLAPRRGRLGPATSSLTVSELRRRIQVTAGTASDQTSSVSALRRAIGAVSDTAAEAIGVSDELVSQLAAIEQDPLFKTAKPGVQADIHADLAAAWAELGQFGPAIEHYRQAITGGGKSVPVTAVEQLANLSMRRAKEPDIDDEQRGQLIVNAEVYLRALDAIGENAERLGLWGSFYKKRASIHGTISQGDIESAAEKYLAAYCAERVSTHFEPNARQLNALARMSNPSIQPIGAAVAEKPGGPSADFWERSGAANRMLTALVEDAVDGHSADARHAKTRVGRMVREYYKAFVLRSSAANRRSVTEHLEDIAQLLPPDRALRPLLEQAAQQLRDVDRQSTTNGRTGSP